MEIELLELITGAGRARGLTVIIDVFRAFSLEPYLFSRGAKEILAVGEEDTARKLKEMNPEAVLIGERKGVKLPGFDYGNSPSQTKSADLSGRLVIHTTSSGTQGLVNASGADEILTGSLVNASAVASYIKQKNPARVSLVAMGLSGRSTAPEDVLCAEYIKSMLEGKPFDIGSGLDGLRKTESAMKFFRPENAEVFPEEDYYMCTRTDIFDYVLKVTGSEYGKGVLRVQKVSGGA